MSQKITSRERIRLAINHKEADRVPIDLGAMSSTGIATIAYNKLKKKLGLNSELARMYDFVQQLAYPEKEVRDIFHIDAIDAGQAFLAKDNNWKEWILNDGSKCLIPIFLKIESDEKGTVLLKDSEDRVLGKKPKTSLYVDQAYWPLKDSPGIPEQFGDKDLSDFVWSVPSPPWHLNILMMISSRILNPVQTTTANMEPEKLKKEFGRDITFWGGGANTRNILPYRSLAEVKEDVKRRVEVFSKGGGFVFNQIHNVLVDVPPENVIAMFEAAYEFGKY